MAYDAKSLPRWLKAAGWSKNRNPLTMCLAQVRKTGRVSRKEDGSYKSKCGSHSPLAKRMRPIAAWKRWTGHRGKIMMSWPGFRKYRKRRHRLPATDLKKKYPMVRFERIPNDTNVRLSRNVWLNLTTARHRHQLAKYNWNAGSVRRSFWSFNMLNRGKKTTVTDLFHCC